MPSNEAELELQSALPEFLVNPEDVRNMIVSEPSVIEPGLRIEAHGAALESDVGTIDLLARDSNGALVVVMVAEPDSQKEVVSEILPRLGWVRKHRAKKGQEVRAIVLLESEPEDLGYEASALADTLSFQVYRVALSFEPVEV